MPRVDYDSYGRSYARHRQTDPRIAVACVTIHHWEPPAAGLAELRRVARAAVVVFTFELEALPAWQLEFLAEVIDADGPRFPSLDEVAATLGGALASSGSQLPPTASTVSSRRSGTVPNACSIPRSAARSRG